MTLFQSAYDGSPPWDIGRPQPAFSPLFERGRGPVLDVGCGTGELALAFAARGLDVLGIDIAPRAIERARDKARARRVAATFEVWDALELARLGRTFSTVVDSAVFHVFDDAERTRYVAALRSALVPGGDYFMLVFSDAEPTDWGGPRRVARAEIEAAFAVGWELRSVEASRMHTTFHEEGGHAWLVHAVRR